MASRFVPVNALHGREVPEGAHSSLPWSTLGLAGLERVKGIEPSS
jgi:hypothetical protein